MASVSSPFFQALRFRLCNSAPLPNTKGNTKCRRNSTVLCFKNDEPEKKLPFLIEEQLGPKRREAMFHLFFAAFSFPPIVADALAENDVNDENFRTYSDDKNKFNLLIPQDWQVGSGEADGIKSLTAFYPQEASSSNVSILITGLGADFTRLESFGKVDAFAETLVGGLDRSWQRPPGVAAKLIDSKASNGLYYIEYSLQNPGESCRHIFSAIGMASNGWYNRLYTVTGQFVEEESEKYRSKIEKSVASFRLN